IAGAGEALTGLGGTDSFGRVCAESSSPAPDPTNAPPAGSSPEPEAVSGGLVGTDSLGCDSAASVAAAEVDTEEDTEEAVASGPSFFDRQSANCSRIYPPTSEIIPRPNWAGLRVIFMSVLTMPSVRSPAPVRVTVMV